MPPTPTPTPRAVSATLPLTPLAIASLHNEINSIVPDYEQRYLAVKVNEIKHLFY